MDQAFKCISQGGLVTPKPLDMGIPNRICITKNVGLGMTLGSDKECPDISMYGVDEDRQVATMKIQRERLWGPKSGQGLSQIRVGDSRTAFIKNGEEKENMGGIHSTPNFYLKQKIYSGTVYVFCRWH